MDIDMLILTKNYTGSGYELGDIIEVSTRGTSPCGHPRFSILRINGVPDKAPPKVLLRRLKRTLTAPIEDNLVLSDPRTIRRRKWRLNRSSIPLKVKRAFQNEKEFTGTWAELKAHLERRTVTVESDRTKDTYTSIVDADV